MRNVPKVKIYDILHKGFVLTCVGMTIYGGVMLADLAYNYCYHIKPELKLKEEALKRELLREGASDLDKAPSINA